MFFQILSFITFLGLIIGYILFWYYLPSYSKEKGKNLATKEDIANITTEVESVKSKYACNLEQLKSDLNKINFVHGILFETEFNSYKEIWNSLIELQRKIFILRPVGTATLGDNKERDEKFKSLANTLKVFLETVDKWRPFYPDQIWKSIDKLLPIVRKEAKEFRYGDPINGKDYWEEKIKNTENILTFVNEISDAIRARIESLRII